MHPRARSLIDFLELRPHPEGGYFREVFRSPHAVHRGDPPQQRAALTTIYFLLAGGMHSRWHRVTSDEIWHHYEGEPLELLWIDGERCERRLLGPAGEESLPVHVVPAGCWQAARPAGRYVLVGCSVGPGFEFADFSMLSDHPEEAARIRDRFPDLSHLI